MDCETYFMLFTTMREKREKWVGDYHLRYVETYDLPKIVISKKIVEKDVKHGDDILQKGGSLLKGLDTFYPEELCYNIKQLEKYDTLTEYLTHVENEYIKNKEEEKRVKSKVDRFLQ